MYLGLVSINPPMENDFRSLWHSRHPLTAYNPHVIKMVAIGAIILIVTPQDVWNGTARNARIIAVNILKMVENIALCI